MAISHLNFRSDILGQATTVNVILPERQLARYPVLYLLHGMSDDCNTWLNATSLERYASTYSFIIVLPQVALSYYTNMVHGEAYWDYITSELPQKMAQWFPVSQKKEATFVAGHSMGGYGAFKWGMQYPDKFQGVVAMSGALDLVSLWSRDQTRTPLFRNIFGSLSDLEISDNNLMGLWSSKLRSEVAPHFLQICGTKDFLYDDNQTFRKGAENNLKNFIYQESPGNHDWQFWDQQIQQVLKFCDSLL